MPSPIYVALDPFTVTLRDNYNRRILYTAITLRVTDQTSSKLLSDYMPEVRSRVLLALSEQNPQTVQTPEGRSALTKSLTTVLEAPYAPNPLGPKISNVLRSEEHTSELQSLMRISYADLCLKKKNKQN